MSQDDLRCSHCKETEERGAWVWCASCRALHHRDCWEIRGACAEPGCDGARFLAECPKPDMTPRTGMHRVDLDTPLELFLLVLAAGTGLASLVLAFTGSFEDVATCLVLTGLFAYLRHACDCTYWLDLDGRQVLYQRDLAGLGKRRLVCTFDEVGAVGVTGTLRRRRRRAVWELGTHDRGKDWEYYVVFVLKDGRVIPVSNPFPADPGRAELRASSLAEDMGVPVLKARPCESVRFVWDGASGTVRVEEAYLSFVAGALFRRMAMLASALLVFGLVMGLRAMRSADSRPSFDHGWTVSREGDLHVLVRDDGKELRYRDQGEVKEYYACMSIRPLPKHHASLATPVFAELRPLDENRQSRAPVIMASLIGANAEMDRELCALFPDPPEAADPPASYLRVEGRRVVLESIDGRGVRMPSAVKFGNGKPRVHVYLLVQGMIWEN